MNNQSFSVISVYTRAQAIEDGVLIDASEVAIVAARPDPPGINR